MNCPKCEKSGVLECIEMEKIPGQYTYKCKSCGAVSVYENGKISCISVRDCADTVVEPKKENAPEVKRPAVPAQGNIKHNYGKQKRR